tara:strand:+ start:4483 stop:5328 length:846 start_codon:yes stop_codon:yes gene_type:complete
MNQELLPESLKEVLTEENVSAIETAIKEKVELTVEAALADQDELYSEKLEELVSAIDKDHTSKLKRVVEAVDTNNANKLVKVVKKYEKDLNESASEFKETLVESISEYLEEYIDESIPQKAIEEATQNRTATEVLSNLRKVLAVDSSLMSESVKAAVVDGKTQIDELNARVQELEKENISLKEGFMETKANLFLEQKTAKLPEKKKEYLVKVLGDKSPSFIEENFEYTARLFDKKEQERIDVIKEEAFDNRQVKADAPVETISEEKKEVRNPYLQELKRMK